MSVILIKDQYDLLPANLKAFPEGLIDHSPSYQDDHEYQNPLEDPFSKQTPSILFGYQKKWLEDNSRIKLWVKSRRIGASWIDALCAVLNSASETGSDSFYTGYNYSMSRQYINDCRYWAEILNVACSEIDEFMFNDESKDILSYKLRFASGFEIIALSSRPENFRSKKGRVTIDEAAFVDLEALMKSATALILWGGQINLISSHNGIATHFNKLLHEANDKTKDISVHQTTLDDAIADGLYKRICLVTNKKWSLESEFEWRKQIIKEYGIYADEELFCIPSTETDILFNSEAIERNAIGSWQPPNNRDFYIAAIDPNFGSTDNYVLTTINISEFPLRLQHEYAANNQSVLKSKEDTIKAIKAYKPHLIAIESNSGGMVIAEDLIRLMPGKTIETLNTNRNNKIINTDRLASMIESNEFIYPKDWLGIAEMKSFSKKLREALIGKDDRIMSSSIGLAFLQQALENLPRRSKPVSKNGRHETISY